ncbi:hypothetical protein ABZ897_42905 [Nonomuraea sp. NPDC046802]|uniref:hypothetical protein n=1 Tax=Nonomuraea sp. NPDC046802 TaxID=3154919 RepID=UPI0033C3C06C
MASPVRHGSCTVRPAARAEEILTLHVEDLDLEFRRARVVSKGGAIEYVHWATPTARLLPRLLAGSAGLAGEACQHRRHLVHPIADIAQRSPGQAQSVSRGRHAGHGGGHLQQLPGGGGDVDQPVRLCPANAEFGGGVRPGELVGGRWNGDGGCESLLLSGDRGVFQQVQVGVPQMRQGDSDSALASVLEETLVSQIAFVLEQAVQVHGDLSGRSG